MTDPTAVEPPAECAWAFKEWEGVCDALVRGDQALILRKGGIAEGPGGFVPEHAAFWLYPTRVHQALQGLKPGAAVPGETITKEPSNEVHLRGLAVVTLIGMVDRIELLPALDDLHVWTPETVESRFRYKRPGLWVLGVRVYTASLSISIPVTPEHAGCKTWVPLATPLSTAGLAPVLDDRSFRSRMDRLSSALGRDDATDRTGAGHIAPADR